MLVSSRAGRFALLSSVLLVGASHHALAASFHITSGTNTTAQTLNSGETGQVDLGAALVVSGSKAITIAGGNVTISNAGTIQDTNSSGRAIDTSFANGNWNIGLTNSGTISSTNDAFRINADIGTGTATLDNFGSIISSSSGQALDFAAITSATATINITNEKGATIQADGDDAIRPGAGTVTITNDGLIDSTQSANRAINLNTNSTANIESFSLTNGADGTIQSQGDALRITASTLSTTATGVFTVDNSGTIKSTGVGSNNGQAIDFNDLVSPSAKITITNESTGVITAADADAIRPGTNATVNNYGLIQSFNGTPTSTGNDGIDFQSTGTGTVNNYAGGQIIGARHGITGDLPITVYNEGSITGQDGSGINMDTASNTTTTVTNKGTITGTAVTGDGDGIDIDGLANINNYGTIKTAGIVAGEINEGLALGGGTINNYAGATIDSVQRAITIDDSNLGNAFGVTNIYNEGTIKGEDGEAIKITSTFDNTITNKGSIIGSTVLGAGNDTVNLYTGSTTGSLDGGDGTDKINLEGTSGSGTLANVSNFEKLNVNGGTWTISGTQSYSNGVTVASGATAKVNGTLNADVTNNGTLAVHSGSATFNGTVTNNGAITSDPSTLTFNTLKTSASGYIQASTGDTYRINGDFDNHSAQGSLWNTSGATLEFVDDNGATTHDLQIVGDDHGIDPYGTERFSWKTLEIDLGDTVDLSNGAGAGNRALYVSSLIGAVITGNVVTNIVGFTGAVIYYDPTVAANSYLHGLDYMLTDGGELVANVPEPASIALLLSGLGAWTLRRRKRAR